MVDYSSDSYIKWVFEDYEETLEIDIWKVSKQDPIKRTSKRVVSTIFFLSLIAVRSKIGSLYNNWLLRSFLIIWFWSEIEDLNQNKCSIFRLEYGRNGNVCRIGCLISGLANINKQWLCGPVPYMLKEENIRGGPFYFLVIILS